MTNVVIPLKEGIQALWMATSLALLDMTNVASRVGLHVITSECELSRLDGYVASALLARHCCVDRNQSQVIHLTS